MSQIRPKDVTTALGISSPTLRLWSNNFAPVLSPAAQRAQNEKGQAVQRRYTSQDLAYFKRAQTLLRDGKTYEETLQVLLSEPVPIEEPSSLHASPLSAPPSAGDTTDEVRLATNETHPVMVAFQEALRSKDQVIASKDEQIQLLTKQLDDLSQTLLIAKEQNPLQISASPNSSTQFRWRWLNWLLKP